MTSIEPIVTDVATEDAPDDSNDALATVTVIPPPVDA